MPNQYAVDNPTLPVNWRYFHLIVILGDCQAVLWEWRAAKMGRQVFGTHMVFRETFLQIQQRLLQLFIRKSRIHGVQAYQNRFTHQRRRRMRIKHQFRIRDAGQDHQPKIQSSPVREILQRILEQTNNDCRFQIPHAINVRLLKKKKRLKTEVCTCSQFPAEAMLWIKEVELVVSVDDLNSSCSVRRIQMPNFEVLDAKIALALNRIIHNSLLQKKNQSGGTKSPEAGPFSFAEDRSLAWSTSTSRSLEPVIPSRVMPTYLLSLFEMMILRTSIRNGKEFYYQWRESHLMTSWKDCTNWEYESLRHSRPYWNCMTCIFIRRKQDLIITDWRQWWKEVSSRIHEIGILRPITEIMKETPWSRIRGLNSVDKNSWRFLAMEVQRAVF